MFNIKNYSLSDIFDMSINKPAHDFDMGSIEKARKKNRRAKYFKKSRKK